MKKQRIEEGGASFRSVLADAASRLRKAGVESPRLDAEVLLSHVTGLDRIEIYLHMDDALLEGKARERYEACVAQREKRTPVAYITGEKEFYGIPYLVSPGVLIPRPDTESVVEAALEILERRAERNPRLLDLCAGSGCIGISLKKAYEQIGESREVSLTLSDIEKEPLCVIEKNLFRQGMKARVIRSDLFENLSEERFDLIVSNPPYIAEGEIDSLEPEISLHEPRTALSGGGDGYDLYKRLISQAGEHLLPGGAIVLEAGYGQSERLIALLEESGFSRAGTRADLSGTPRAVFAFFTGS